MSRVKEFGVCPICGKSDDLSLSPRSWFYEILHQDRKGSCVCIRCKNCCLDLYQYTYKWSECNTWNYDIVVGELKKKWAKLKQ